MASNKKQQYNPDFCLDMAMKDLAAQAKSEKQLLENEGNSRAAHNKIVKILRTHFKTRIQISQNSTIDDNSKTRTFAAAISVYDAQKKEYILISEAAHSINIEGIQAEDSSLLSQQQMVLRTALDNLGMDTSLLLKPELKDKGDSQNAESFEKPQDGADEAHITEEADVKVDSEKKTVPEEADVKVDSEKKAATKEADVKVDSEKKVAPEEADVKVEVEKKAAPEEATSEETGEKIIKEDFYNEMLEMMREKDITEEQVLASLNERLRPATLRELQAKQAYRLKFKIKSAEPEYWQKQSEKIEKRRQKEEKLAKKAAAKAQISTSGDNNSHSATAAPLQHEPQKPVTIDDSSEKIKKINTLLTRVFKDRQGYAIQQLNIDGVGDSQAFNDYLLNCDIEKLDALLKQLSKIRVPRK